MNSSRLGSKKLVNWRVRLWNFRVCFVSWCYSSSSTRKIVWTITLTLKKQVYLFLLSKKNEVGTAKMQRAKPPHDQFRKLQGLCSSSAEMALHHTHSAAMFFLLLLSQFALFCQSDVGSREWGTPSKEKAHMYFHNTRTHTVPGWELNSERTAHAAQDRVESDISPNWR